MHVSGLSARVGNGVVRRRFRHEYWLILLLFVLYVYSGGYMFASAGNVAASSRQASPLLAILTLSLGGAAVFFTLMLARISRDAIS
ncbi:MAG: hypothetical protein M3281_00190, partial [Chloroflexota bacterium]|nr:hypothetical protein [Chloroflexota bacterium]